MTLIVPQHRVGSPCPGNGAGSAAGMAVWRGRAVRVLLACLALACAAPGAGHAQSDESRRQAGMNLHWVRDWLPPTLADAMQSNRTRRWQRVGTTQDLSASQLNADGWPLVDAEIALWHGAPQARTGVYTLLFRGRADISIQWTSDASIVSNDYDAATNRSVARMRLNRSTAALRLKFSNTSGGVQDVRVLRPIAEGSDVSHDPDEVVDRVLAAQLRGLSIIRYMDALNTNAAPETSWSTRAIPGSRRNLQGFNPFAGATASNAFGYVGGNTSTGVPFEYIVAIANATGTDPFICIPAMADDTFIRNVALLFKYGSDGVQPYTSPQANPVWPPLDPERRLYVEYSNEVWNTNSGFRQNHFSRYESVRLVNADLNHPLNSDRVVTTAGSAADAVWTLRARYTVWRAAAVSDIFRDVFGADIHRRVRPLFCWQIRRKASDALPELHWAQTYFTTVHGRGLAYYFWGGGPADYRSSRGEPFSNVDELLEAGTLAYADHLANMTYNAHLAATYGLRLITYEGGPSFGDPNGSSGEWQDLAPAAHADPRMYGKVVETLDVLERVGGAFSTQYVWHHGWAWSFVHPDTFSDDTHRARAMYDAKGAARVSPEIGQVVPLAIPGRRYNSFDPGWKTDDAAATGTASVGAGERVGYALRTSTGGAFSVRVRYRTSAATRLIVTVNGNLALDLALPGATTSSLTTPHVFLLRPDSVGGLSILNAGTGGLTVEEVLIDQVAEDVAPIITAEPVDVTVDAGGLARFTVEAFAQPAPAFQWMKGGVDLPGIQAATLELPNVQPGSAGVYSVRITNRAGNATSRAARLTVNAAPDDLPPVAAFTATPANGPAPLAVRLDASTSSDPEGAPLSFSWDVGDGAGFTAGGAVRNHTFFVAGTYTVRVLVQDARNSSLATAVVEVAEGSGPPPSYTLAAWDFAGTNGQASRAPTETGPSVIASAAALGSGLSPLSYNGGAGLTGNNQTASTLAGALADADYIGWTIEPSPGLGLTVTRLLIRPVSQNLSRTFTLFSSVAGFDAGAALHAFTASGNQGLALVDLPITGISGRTEPVEFRLYVHGGTNQFQSAGIGIGTGNDLVVEGYVVAPPPPPLTGFAAWVAAHFSPEQAADPLMSGPDAAPLGDGVANRLKFAVNADPWEQIRIINPTAPHSDGRPGFVFNRRLDNTQHPLVIEATVDFVNWTAGYVETVIATTAEQEVVVVRPVSWDGTGVWFVRLRAQ